MVAVDAVFDARAANAFCAVRPPGHHATADAGMGFCIFNNAALAARYAQRRYGISRALIVDWDLHHGNGTQDIFYEDGSVFYFSTHQWPMYPGTGLSGETGMGHGLGTTLNCPVPAGAAGKEIVGAFHQQLLPAADSFKPDLVHAHDWLVAFRRPVSSTSGIGPMSWPALVTARLRWACRRRASA